MTLPAHTRREEKPSGDRIEAIAFSRTSKGPAWREFNGWIDWPESLSPMRKFSWYQNQRHLPGLYWSATMRDHVGYESRHELASATLADFDRNVVGIHSQPVTFKLVLDGKRRVHTPDYLLVMRDGTTVLRNVKTDHALERRPELLVYFDQLEEVLRNAGQRHELWTRPPSPTFFHNVHQLSQFRNPDLFRNVDYPAILADVRHARTVGEAEQWVKGERFATARALVRHALWRCDLRANLHEVLTDATRLIGVHG